MLDPKILAVAQAEILRHRHDYIELNGRTTLGCTGCKKYLLYREQYMRHLAEDVLPQILARALAAQSRTLAPIVPW